MMYCKETVVGAKRALVSPRSRARHRACRGIALVWSALMLIIMVLVVGLSLDWGKVAWNVHQLQNAADAAALAGAQIVKLSSPSETVSRAHGFALDNSADQLPVWLRQTLQTEPFAGDEAPFDVLVGRWVVYNRTFVPTLDAPNAVKAIARRDASLDPETAPALGLVFGPIVGLHTVDASLAAVAACMDSGGAGLICLSESAVPGLSISGNSIVDVEGGGIHVNSTAASDNPSGHLDGADILQNAWLDAGFLNVAGEVTPDPESDDWANIQGIAEDGSAAITVTEGADIIPDPLAAALVDNPYVSADGPSGIHDHLDLPNLIENGTILSPTQTLEGTPITDTITTDCTLGPGYYPHGVSINNGVTVTLQPTGESGLGTLFVFGGGTGQPLSLGSGLTVNGGTLIGHGVTCYVTKNFDTNVLGVTDWGAGSLIDLWSPGDWAIRDHARPLSAADVDLVSGLNGIAVWQDPTMVDAKGETPVVHLNGTPEGGVHGTLYFPDPIHVLLNGDLGQMGNQILCGSADILGNATFSVDYDARNQPGKSSKIRLVR